jgi:LAO/AO transport system kinase
MMRLPFLETRFLNRQFLLRGRSSAANIYTLSKTFQIVQATQELDSREENVVDTLYNGLLSSNRACLAQSITLTESTHPRKRLQARSLLKKALQHCKQCQEKDNSYSFRIGTRIVVQTSG